MIAIYLILFTVLLNSAGSIVRKKISSLDEKYNYIYSVLFQFGGGVAVFIFSLLLGFGDEYNYFLSSLNVLVILKMLLSASLWFGATLTSFLALHSISASKYSVIETLSPLISIVFAVLLLNENFKGIQIMGMIFILISVFAVVYDKEQKIASHFGKGEKIALLSAVFSGLALVNDKGIYFATPLTPTLCLMFFLPGIIGLLFKPKEIKKIGAVMQNKKIVRQLILLSFIWGLAAIGYYKAIVLSNSLSLVVSLSQLSVIVTVILGLIFLKEIDNWKIKIAAAVLSVGGLILMTLQ